MTLPIQDVAGADLPSFLGKPLVFHIIRQVLVGRWTIHYSKVKIDTSLMLKAYTFRIISSGFLLFSL